MLPTLIQLLWLLFYVGIGVAVVFVIIWFLTSVLELSLPQRAIRVIWGLFALLVLIYLLSWLATGSILVPHVG